MKQLKTLFAALGIALLMAGTVQAKDDAKPMGKAAASAPAAASAKASAPAAAGDLIDLNTATEKELATLPKIGDVRAKAIIAGRPYRAKNQLVEKKIISQDVYDAIKDKVIAKQGAAGDKAASKDKAAAGDKKK
jgi:competence protein ComEA